MGVVAEAAPQIAVHHIVRRITVAAAAFSRLVALQTVTAAVEAEAPVVALDVIIPAATAAAVMIPAEIASIQAVVVARNRDTNEAIIIG